MTRRVGKGKSGPGKRPSRDNRILLYVDRVRVSLRDMGVRSADSNHEGRDCLILPASSATDE